MKFDELRNYLENEIKLGKVTYPPDAEQLGSSKKYQFIAVLSLFENNGEATWEQIKTRLGQLDPTYTGKAFNGMKNFLQTNKIPRLSKILFWHTGGIFNLISNEIYK